MKTIVKAAALVLAPMTAIALTAVPAAAQTKSGIAVVDLEEAVAKSSAFTTAMTQMQTTYKPQLDQIAFAPEADPPRGCAFAALADFPSAEMKLVE